MFNDIKLVELAQWNDPAYDGSTMNLLTVDCVSSLVLAFVPPPTMEGNLLSPTPRAWVSTPAAASQLNFEGPSSTSSIHRFIANTSHHWRDINLSFRFGTGVSECYCMLHTQRVRDSESVSEAVMTSWLGRLGFSFLFGLTSGGEVRSLCQALLQFVGC